MQLFANNADSELNGAITSVATSITLKTGGGAKFPTPTGGDFFLVTMFQKVGATELNHEIVKCTARSGDVLTVVRAQEGTTGFAFSNADPVELRFTKGSAENLVQDADLSAHVGSGGAAHANVVAAGAAGFMTGADKTKLDGVATGATANTGTVTTASVITGNGFAGTVANPTTAPAITLTTNVTGILKGNGTALSAAAASDITGQALTGYVSGAGTVAATDTVLQAINKLNGNDALKAPLTNAVLTTPRAISLAIGPDGDILLYESTTDTLAVRTGAVGSEKYFTFGANGAFSVNNGTVVVSATTLATNLNADLLDGQHGSYYAANVLTGYSSAPGTVAATDTVLQAIQKLNGNIAAASGNAASSLYLAANFGAL